VVLLSVARANIPVCTLHGLDPIISGKPVENRRFRERCSLFLKKRAVEGLEEELR